ncbi:hypothetical protein BC834DRAFT_972341 [Gloeopeniophorella convolvens]|nr:hypothetical protein BC834DRAFT_972341 [Gloeopeniophorella convolvens]
MSARSRLEQDLHALPSTPSSPSSPDPRARHSNPLVDLIDTEKLYVDQLAGIIRKLAPAWSRTDLPPHDLGFMFRSLEGVYKADHSFLVRLREIGTDPSSPEALGDLLIRWIDELEAPYTSYCERYCTGFDLWEPVRNNLHLSDVLAAFSASLPPPGASSTAPVWTLDELFLLPKARLKYLKNNHDRLFKGTQPGRNDHKLLSGGVEKLESSSTSTPAVLDMEDEVVADLSRVRTLPSVDTVTGSETSSARGSSFSSAVRSPNDTSLPLIDPRPAENLQIPLLELEGRLSTERCLDIFTMKPRRVRLQFLPPTLPYARTVRIGVDATIRFIPRSTGVEVNHPGCRIYILSDLFLVSERMAPGERSADSPAADMWLLYPPFTGKYLKLAKTKGDDRALDVTIIRREKLTLVFTSVLLRDKVFFELSECVDFASAVHAQAKHPIPPMPLLNSAPEPSSGPAEALPASQATPDFSQPTPSESSRSSTPHRVSSPVGSLGSHSPQRGSDPPSRNSPPASPASSTWSLVSSPEAQVQQGVGRVPSLHDPSPGPNASDPQVPGSLSPPPIALIPRAGPLPQHQQAIGSGWFKSVPPYRTTSVDPVKCGLPLGMAPPLGIGLPDLFAQRAPQSLLQSPRVAGSCF